MGDIGEFVIGVPKEVIRFTLRVKDLRVTLESDLPCNPSIQFDIGASIGIASKWEMGIQAKGRDGCCGLEDKCVQLYLSRLILPRVAGLRHFICTATLKNKDGQDYVSFKLNQRNPVVKLNDFIDAHQIGNDLVIQVEFVLCSSTFVTTTGNDALIGGGDVLKNYGDLLNTGDNSDFVIQVKKMSGEFEEIRVHKAILSARSSFFKTMLDTGMKERENGTWIIEDLGPECVKIMLNHIYTGNLDDADDGWKKVPDEMVRAADKYNLPILLNFLNRRLHNVCTFTNAINLRRLAKLHELDIAVKNINAFICSNIDSILG